MREILATALCGDDVYEEDPEILKHEQFMARIFGKESALFVMTGTMGNLLSILRIEQNTCTSMNYYAGIIRHRIKFEFESYFYVQF